MAAEPVQLPTSGSLAGILDVLETDEDFRALISDEIEVPESDIDPSITVGVPEGLRPALAAGAAGTRPVVLVVASGREAEEMVEAIRSWYSGDPNDVAQLEAWETLPHERLSPRADTVASRMAVFRRLMHPQEGSKLFGPIRILVMPVRSLIQPVVAGLGDVEPLVFSQGEELALDEASHRLVENAYTRVDLVMDRGEFAVPYDSMIGKLIVWGPTRADALATCRRALDEITVEGIKTTIPFQKLITNHKNFIEGKYDTGFVERLMQERATPHKEEGK